MKAEKIGTQFSRQAQPLSRRQFLRFVTGGAMMALTACTRLPTPAPAMPTSATATSTLAPIAIRQRSIEMTAVESFYQQHYQSVENVPLDSWHLTIDGLVEQPLQLNYEELISHPQIEWMRTLECIGNPVGGNQIGNAVWNGIALEPLLAKAGVRAEAKRVLLRAADGYETSIPVAQLRGPDVRLAYGMNGDPLTPEHGYPLRLFIPGLYGQKMPKWLTQITFSEDADHRGFWEKQGWSDSAEVKTNSQIIVPEHISRHPAQPIEIFGIGYAGTRSITGIDVGVERVGDLTVWHDAELLSPPAQDVWTQFYFNWVAPGPGAYTLLVRACDETGFMQSERAQGILEGAFPDGTDKIHNIVIRVN